MGAHAILSPSGASRWLVCTKSARLEATFPDRAGAAADEGTLAHALGELITRYRLKKIGKRLYERELAEIESNPQYDHAMQEHADNYSVFVLEKLSEARAHTKDAQIFLEQRLNLTDYVPEGFGTGDAIIIADHVLDLIDLKYGKGVAVNVQNNRQLMLYALGALREFDMLYDISTVRMTIYQPRMDNISTWELPVQDLRSWGEETLRPLAALAFKGEGEYTPGDHCRFCRARAVCKAHADMHLEIARYEFAEPVLLADQQVSDVLDRMDGIRAWLTAVEEYALSLAVTENKKWPGYKLVTGRSNRVYKDEEAVAQTLTGKGYAEDVIYKKKIIGIGDMEKLLGKAGFNTLLSDLVIKPEGKPTLAPLSDKRPEYNSLEKALAEFEIY